MSDDFAKILSEILEQKEQLSPDEELAFQEWFRNTPAFNEVKQRFGVELDPDIPEFDYREQFKSILQGGSGGGLDPQTGEMHFSSEFKTPHHPTRFKSLQGPSDTQTDTKTGRDIGLFEETLLKQLFNKL